MERSLLKRSNEGRFYLHDLPKKYAAERLAENETMLEECCERHSRYYVDLLIELEDDLMGSKINAARDEVSREMDNVRASVRWASLHWDAQAVLPVFHSYLTFFAVQSWHEGVNSFRDMAEARREWLQQRNVSFTANDAVMLSARTYQAFLLANLSRSDESEIIARACLEPLTALTAGRELSACYLSIGLNASFRGEYEESIAYLEKAVLLGKESKHILWPTYLLWLGETYCLSGEYEQGMMALQKCYDVFDQRGSQWGKAFALSKMGAAADGLGAYEQAMRYHKEAVSTFEEIQQPIGKAYMFSRMSMSAYFLENYDHAIQFGQQGYETFYSLGHHWGINVSLCRTGFAYIGLGETEKARECFIAALRAVLGQSTPLMLYAILGLACSLVQSKRARLGLALYRYASANPKTPSIYPVQAKRWFEYVPLSALEDRFGVEIIQSESDPLEAVAERLLQYLEVTYGDS